MPKERLIVVAAITWLAIGILLTPVVETIMINSGTFVRRSIFPDWCYLLLSVILALPIVLLMEKTGSIFSRLATGLPFVLHSFPALACLLQSPLYIMVFPVGIYALLCSPFNPLYVLPSTRWLLTEILPDLGLYTLLFFPGIFLFASGLGIFSVAFIQFLKRKGLVTSGLYSIVRHPQYLGIILATLGLTLLQYVIRLMTLISWVIVVFSYVWLARREEDSLQEKYGEQFLDHKREVPFIMPSLSIVTRIFKGEK